MLINILYLIVQHLPEWCIRCWPLNIWFVVRADEEKRFEVFSVGHDYIVNKETGIMYQGSPRIQ